MTNYATNIKEILIYPILAPELASISNLHVISPPKQLVLLSTAL
jgi:hypothetical protein